MKMSLKGDVLSDMKVPRVDTGTVSSCILWSFHRLHPARCRGIRVTVTVNAAGRSERKFRPTVPGLVYEGKR